MRKNDTPPADSPEAFAALTEILDLDSLQGARTLEDIFLGQSQWQPSGRVFGGQVLAQALVAAQRTVVPDAGKPERPAHSLHAYFLRPGDASRPISFGVERLRDGGSFSSRRVHAYQDGRTILSLMASFQEAAPGPEHQETWHAVVPDPEELPTTADLIGHIDHPYVRHWANDRPFDLRHIGEPIYLKPAGAPLHRQQVWIRASGGGGGEALTPGMEAALLAYACDYVMLEPVLLAHQESWSSPGVKMASLDHAMWWHRPASVRDWLLFDLESPSSENGRGVTFGKVYDRGGNLVATLAQQGMVRFPG